MCVCFCGLERNSELCIAACVTECEKYVCQMCAHNNANNDVTIFALGCINSKTFRLVNKRLKQRTRLFSLQQIK